MPTPPSPYRPYAEIGAVVLVAAAIAVGAYAILDFSVFSEDALLQLFLVSIPTVLATGLAVAFIRNRLADDPWVHSDRLRFRSIEPWGLVVGAERLSALAR